MLQNNRFVSMAVLLLALSAQAATFTDRAGLKAAVNEWIADPTQAALDHGDISNDAPLCG